MDIVNKGQSYSVMIVNSPDFFYTVIGSGKDTLSSEMAAICET